MRNVCLLAFLFFAFQGFSQERYEYVYRNPSDSTFNCYLKHYPEGEIKGLVVRDYTNLYDASTKSPYAFLGHCLDQGLMVLVTNTSTIFPELFASDQVMLRLDSMIQKVVIEHSIPEENIFIGGISASGARALRFAEFSAQGKSKTKINGVFAVDSPLDLERFYKSARDHKHNFKAGMLWEAEYMVPYFDSLFGGSPEMYPEAYVNASVFSEQDSLGGNAQYLKNTSIMMFHEPDMDWWINERGASYFDINSYDLARLNVLLNRLGNSDVTLITSTGLGFNRKGERNCHSWTIVDELMLVDWMVERLK